MSVCFINNDGSGTAPLQEACFEKLKADSKQEVDYLTYIFYSTCLVLLSPFSLLAKTCHIAVNFFKRQDQHYANLQDHIKKYTLTHVKNYNEEDLIQLTRHIQKLPEFGKHVILDIISLESNLSHIGPILQGANVKIVGDNGELFRIWKNLDTAKQRASSHRCDTDLAYSINGNMFKEFLFWKDRETHETRFQLEAHTIQNPISNLPSLVLHLRDYLNYKRHGLQQGQFGESPFTENRPIVITFDKEVFEKNRLELNNLMQTLNENPVTS